MTRWLAGVLDRHNIHFGWAVVAATFLTTLVSAGAMGSAGVFILPLQQEFGWSTADISAALAIRFMLFGLMAPFAAALLNRFGLRNISVTALLIVMAGLGLSVFMTSLSQLFILWGVIVGLGSGMTALVLGATVATRWFVARRGIVVGLLGASLAAGQLVFTPFAAALTEWLGWRGALVVLCAFLGVATLIAMLLMRDYPADVGLRAYGDDGKDPQPAPAPAAGSVFTAPLIALRDASTSSSFWILFATFFICGLSTNGLVQMHFVPLCVDFGMTATAAAGLLGITGGFNFVGTIASGWLSDRFDNRWLLFWYYGLRGLSLMMLPFTDFSLLGLSIFAVFYGLDWIATVPPTVKLTAKNFAPAQANMVFGWIFAGHQLGAATASYGGGLSKTMLATYLPAFFAAGAMCLIAAVIVLWVGERRTPAPQVVPA
jgi:MFS family permease